MFDCEKYRYNKTEKDFPSLFEYNNYLEEVEDISELLFKYSNSVITPLLFDMHFLLHESSI